MNFNILLILLMGFITFCCRYIFIAIPKKGQMSARWGTVLSYIPPAFLATMIVPSILLSEVGRIKVVGNPYLYAAIITLVITKFTKNFAVVTIAGTAVFFLFRIVFSFCNIA